MMRGPPEAPASATALPSRNTMVGLIEDNGRLPGWGALAADCTKPNALGSPGRAVKSSISSFSMKPKPSTHTQDPHDKLMVSVHDTAIPFASTTLRWLVPASSWGVGAVP